MDGAHSWMAPTAMRTGTVLCDEGDVEAWAEGAWVWFGRERWRGVQCREPRGEGYTSRIGVITNKYFCLQVGLAAEDAR